MSKVRQDTTTAHTPNVLEVPSEAMKKVATDVASAVAI